MQKNQETSQERDKRLAARRIKERDERAKKKGVLTKVLIPEPEIDFSQEKQKKQEEKQQAIIDKAAAEKEEFTQLMLEVATIHDTNIEQEAIDLYWKHMSMFKQPTVMGALIRCLQKVPHFPAFCELFQEAVKLRKRGRK